MTKTMKKRVARLIFEKYADELAMRLGLNSHRGLRAKCHKLSISDPEFLTNVQNDAETDAWQWARAMGLPTDDETWELFQDIRFKRGF